MTSNAGHFLFILNSQRDYFAFFSVAGAVVSAFLSFEQQAFLSEEQQAFFSVAVHSFFSVFLLSSLVVEAFTVEAAKPIVKASARTIANFFMISNFIG
jgi:hypothetical protein